MQQYELLWKYQQVDMELDQYEREMRASSNRKELLKHRDFLLEQQNVLKKIEADVEIMSDRMEALADEARAWDLKTVVHAHTDPGLHNAIVAGIEQIHHGQWASPEHIRIMQEKNLYYMPILKITSQRNYSSWDSRPWMQKKMMDAAPNHRDAVRLAKEMGVKLMVGCIYPGPGDRWVCGEGTSFEMMEMQKCGLTPMEILVAATKHNAEGYGKGHEIGTLEPGKQADVVILDKDPLADISVLHDQQSICAVFCDGRNVYHR